MRLQLNAWRALSSAQSRQSCRLSKAEMTLGPAGWKARATKSAGVTLMEVLIAVTLLSILTVAMLSAMRISLNTFGKANARLMDNRRVAGAQRILLDQIEGMTPVMAPCIGTPEAGAQRIPFFQGGPDAMRLVSTFSLQQAWRGGPQILEFAVISGEGGRGVRLIVNEIAYTGPPSAGRLCLGFAPDPVTRLSLPVFAPVLPSPQSFVLADKLEFCRFSYLPQPPQPGIPPVWTNSWVAGTWPQGVRIEMAPLQPDRSQLTPITVTAPIHLYRNPSVQYADF